MNAQTVLHVLSTVWSSLVKAWSGIGPLIGVLIGGWLTSRWQRKQWVLDNKKSEYRELITTLSESYHNIVKNWPSPIAPSGRIIGTMSEGEEIRQSIEAGMAGKRVIADRIFIDKQMRVENIRERWDLLAAERDFTRLRDYWINLHDALLKMAHRDLDIKD